MLAWDRRRLYHPFMIRRIKLALWFLWQLITLPAAERRELLAHAERLRNMTENELRAENEALRSQLREAERRDAESDGGGHG